MKTLRQKKEELARLREGLAKSRLTVFTSFARVGEKGLNVGGMRELKKTLKAVQSEYLVGKKTLINKALGGSQDVFGYAGSLGLVFSRGDEAAAAKTLYGFTRKNPALKFFGALLGGKFVDGEQFVGLAKLPSREVLIGRVAGMMKYPLSGLVSVLRGNIRNLVAVLNEINKVKT